MKKLLIIGLSLLSFHAIAQDTKEVDLRKNKERSEKRKELAKVDWSKFVNVDFVADGQTTYDVLAVKRGQIFQVRFYERGLRPMNLSQTRPYEVSGYTVQDDSRVLSVKATSDGSICVIMAAGDQTGPFTESINILNATSRGYFLRINGVIEDPDKAKEAEKKEDKKSN